MNHAHNRGEMGLSWAGTVAMIDLRLPTGREGGRRRGRERCRWGGTDCAKRMRVERWRYRREGWWRVRQSWRVIVGLVTLSGGKGAVKRRRGGFFLCFDRDFNPLIFYRTMVDLILFLLVEYCKGSKLCTRVKALNFTSILSNCGRDATTNGGQTPLPKDSRPTQVKS